LLFFLMTVLEKKLYEKIEIFSKFGFRASTY
jgi:hypothetical protein